jgi:hypothetical protein
VINRVVTALVCGLDRCCVGMSTLNLWLKLYPLFNFNKNTANLSFSKSMLWVRKHWQGLFCWYCCQHLGIFVIVQSTAVMKIPLDEINVIDLYMKKALHIWRPWKHHRLHNTSQPSSAGGGFWNMRPSMWAAIGPSAPCWRQVWMMAGVGETFSNPHQTCSCVQEGWPSRGKIKWALQGVLCVVVAYLEWPLNNIT